MANWAKLQEDLTGLPVVKRAKHSIHFAKGDGQIVANFSGKPCHYEENGIWKALDTAIVELEDGSLGAKGVPVRLNLNGLVRIINEQNEDLYSQVTTRVGVFNSTTRNLVDYINLPVGTVQDDLLVKDTDLYSHSLRLTETGLREELVIKKKPAFITDNANLWLVLDTVVTGVTFEDGWLDQFEIAQMHFPPPTATDAEGREGTAKRYAKNIGGVQHIFTGLKFSELYRAVYPVTIDPDFSTTSTAGDVALALHPRNMGAEENFRITYGLILLRFDLSSIPSSATATAATIDFYQTDTNTQNRTRSGNMYKITDANGDWIEGTGTFKANAIEGEPTGYAKEADGLGGVKTAWAGSNMLGTAGTDYIDTELIDGISFNDTNVVGHKYTGTFNASGLAVLQDWFGDATNNGIKFSFGSNCGTTIGSSENTTESYRPVLTVTYTGGSTGVPKHFLHYARLRSN